MSRSRSARRKDVEVAGRAELVRRAQVRAMRRLLLRWRETARGELPESGSEVLAWVTWPDGRGRDGYQKAFYDDQNGWWWFDYHADGWVITHWMPLPEPPVGEGVQRSVVRGQRADDGDTERVL